MDLFWDNASTTPVENAVVERMTAFMREAYHNPSALYDKARSVKKQVEAARQTIAAALHCNADGITFVSGATEANNWVFYSGFKNKKGNIVISEGEHPSVYQPAFALKNKGYDVRTVRLTADGDIDVEEFERAVDENTSLVSVMHCSNETGTCNPIAALVKIVRKKAPQALFHSDGVQAFRKTDTDLPFMGVDLYSISAHKIGGPKGIGALYAARPLPPMMLGGGQENGKRSGTENTAGIVGFAAAVETFTSTAPEHRSLLLRELSQIDDCRINGAPEKNSGYIVSVSVRGVKAEVLQHMLSDHGMYVGTGSACSSRARDNRVLKSMGVTQSDIEGNIRISPGRKTTAEEIIEGVRLMRTCIQNLRGKIHV